MKSLDNTILESIWMNEYSRIMKKFTYERNKEEGLPDCIVKCSMKLL